MSLRISFEGIDLKKFTSVFGSNDTVLLKKVSDGKRRGVQTALKSIVQGRLTRTSAEPKKRKVKSAIPWKKIRTWLGRINPIPFFGALDRQANYEGRYDLKSRFFYIAYSVWFTASAIIWAILLIIVCIVLVIPVLCLLLYWKIKELMYGPEKKEHRIKSHTIREALRVLIDELQESLEPNILLAAPMGVKWQGMDVYIRSLDRIDSRTEQLLGYFLCPRPFFKEEYTDGGDYYGYLTNAEVQELVDAFEKYPEMQEDGDKEYEFFKQVAAAKKDLWYEAM